MYMKKIINITGNIFDAAEIAGVYITATDRTDGNYSTIYVVHIIVNSVDVVVYEGIGIDARGVRDKIINAIAANAEIIKI
jgi:hypothetical protein